MEFPKWWWKLPIQARYPLCVIGAWAYLLFSYTVLLVLAIIIGALAWLKNDLPELIKGTWDEHWETLRIYKLLRDKQIDQKNGKSSKLVLTKSEITGKPDDDKLAH